VLGVSVDITQRKQAYEEAQQKEERLQSLFRISQYEADDVQDLLDYALHEAIQLTGSQVGYIYHYEEASDRFILNTWSEGVMDACSIADPNTVYHLEKTGLWGEAVRQRQPILVNDFQAPNPLKRGYPEGHVELHNFLTVPIFSQDEIVAVVGVGNKATDYDESDVRQLKLLMDSIWKVAERKRAHEERERLAARIRRQANRLQRILESVPEGVLVLDADGRILRANPVAKTDLEMLGGFGEGDAISHLGGRPLRELLTSPPKGLWHEIEADGRVFEVIARPMAPDLEIERWVLVMNDVTEEREVRRQLRQQEQLAALGQLAGGIAHDFNNILASIILYAQMPLADGSLSSQARESLRTIVKESHRAADLVQQILDFSRHAMIETEPLSLTRLVDDAFGLLRRTIPENIHLEAEMTARPCTVQADPTRIHQALMNLALNAKDAMPEGGELRLSVDRVHVASEKDAPVADMPPGAWARLTVSDTGTGMTEEAQDHLFEPFFTTKEPGKGTGLGLAQVYGIVKQHQGFIDVDTAAGVGTTFTLFLPLLEGEEDQEPSEFDVDASEGHGETILVVEDAERLRRAVEAGLTSLGYQVITAAHGRQALEVLVAQDVDLVLTDVVMPEMGGEALLHRLRAEAPELKVIAMTGHVMDADVSGLRQAGFTDALPKPFSIEDLTRIVRDVLDRPPVRS
jgi:signal transduction histidine kinase